MIPPNENGNFVACMEDILDVYKRPYDKDYPVICMDEQPVQLLKDVRDPIEAEPGKLERRDYEYERCGTVACFMFTEALGGWRKVNVKEQRTAIDWAKEISKLLNEDYPDAKKVTLVCDNLNTHTLGSFYKAFAPEEARRLIGRLEIHHTPKHGSWLNIAEIELSVFTGQCLGRRISTIEALASEAKAWARCRNENQKSVDWQFTTADARVKLKRLYPQIQME